MDELAVAKEILTWLRDSKEFALEQAPLLAREVLNWGIASHLFWFVISITLAITFVFITRLFYRNYQNAEVFDRDGAALGMFLSGIVYAVFTSTTLYNLARLIQIWVAPRLYLLEQLRHLVP